MTVRAGTLGASPLGERALEFVRDGGVVGLGSGRAASDFVRALAGSVAAGLRVRGVPTSEATRRLAAELGVPLAPFAELERIDVTVDGADEVDPDGNLIKGYGGALVREKIVAAASETLVIVVGEEKLVQKLGSRGRLPLEVVPFGLEFALRRLAALGLPAKPRPAPGWEGTATSDNGNALVDCRIGPLERPDELEASLRAVPGVVGTGFFLGMADEVLVARGGEVERRSFSRREGTCSSE